jgi:hypothetical protein
VVEITSDPEATDPGQRAVDEQGRQPSHQPIIPSGDLIGGVGAVVDKVKLFDWAFRNETAGELGEMVIVVTARSGSLLAHPVVHRYKGFVSQYPGST